MAHRGIPLNAEYKYRAFISYSHQDKTWGDWLHKGLESYRVPKPLIGRETRFGPVPARLFPVFRDREELPTTSDLSHAIDDALRDSLMLIVMCSPASAASQWVNEEIRAFKHLHGEDRILAIVIGGEPNATDKGAPTDECFPEALRYKVGPDGALTDERTEPIAADARPHGDGKDDALLKLLSGVLAVNFNDLKQREVQAARRRARIAQKHRKCDGRACACGCWCGVGSPIRTNRSPKNNAQWPSPNARSPRLKPAARMPSAT